MIAIGKNIWEQIANHDQKQMIKSVKFELKPQSEDALPVIILILTISTLFQATS